MERQISPLSVVAHGGTIMKAGFQSDRTSADVADAVYVQTNLVSDIPGLAEATDPHLVNPWGVSFRAGSPFWISDQGSNSTTLYRSPRSDPRAPRDRFPIRTTRLSC